MLKIVLKKIRPAKRDIILVWLIKETSLYCIMEMCTLTIAVYNFTVHTVTWSDVVVVLLEYFIFIVALMTQHI